MQEWAERIARQGVPREKKREERESERRRGKMRPPYQLPSATCASLSAKSENPIEIHSETKLILRDFLGNVNKIVIKRGGGRQSLCVLCYLTKILSLSIQMTKIK